jgi:hypothetical protein
VSSKGGTGDGLEPSQEICVFWVSEFCQLNGGGMAVGSGLTLSSQQISGRSSTP